jgi:hypothetical protein
LDCISERNGYNMSAYNTDIGGYVMKRAVMIVAAFIVVVLLTVAAQA